MKRIPFRLFVVFLAALILISGCANQNQDKAGQGNDNTVKVKNVDEDEGNKVIQTDEQDAVIPIIQHQGQAYISLRQLTDALEFRTDWDPETGKLLVGDNDIAYEIPTNSKTAAREEETVALDNSTIILEGKTYIPKDAVDKIFADAMNYTWTNSELRIRPNREMSDDEADKLPDFQDDPNDPANNDNMNTSFLTQEVSSGFGGLALRSVNENRLIQTARRYIGVKYDFGAAPYPRSNRFDCSTYTQYVYGKYNVYLPRSSRNQAKKGIAVRRTNLRKGDLMFFYLPGRYKSNKIVGHVGIYMGNGKMIHSSNQPKNGVQITSINKSFWKKTYLKSRRVTS